MQFCITRHFQLIHDENTEINNSTAFRGECFVRLRMKNEMVFGLVKSGCHIYFFSEVVTDAIGYFRANRENCAKTTADNTQKIVWKTSNDRVVLLPFAMINS